MPGKFTGQTVLNLVNVVYIAEELINGQNCIRLQGSGRREDTTVWIDTDKAIIRRIEYEIIPSTEFQESTMESLKRVCPDRLESLRRESPDLFNALSNPELDNEERQFSCHFDYSDAQFDCSPHDPVFSEEIISQYWQWNQVQGAEAHARRISGP